MGLRKRREWRIKRVCDGDTEEGLRGWHWREWRRRRRRMIYCTSLCERMGFGVADSMIHFFCCNKLFQFASFLYCLQWWGSFFNWMWIDLGLLWDSWSGLILGIWGFWIWFFFSCNLWIFLFQKLYSHTFFNNLWQLKIIINYI